jgi:hypothetical protein
MKNSKGPESNPENPVNPVSESFSLPQMHTDRTQIGKAVVGQAHRLPLLILNRQAERLPYNYL